MFVFYIASGWEIIYEIIDLLKPKKSTEEEKGGKKIKKEKEKEKGKGK